jgi:hypothetical protein
MCASQRLARAALKHRCVTAGKALCEFDVTGRARVGSRGQAQLAAGRVHDQRVAEKLDLLLVAHAYEKLGPPWIAKPEPLGFTKPQHPLIIDVRN